MNVVSRICGHSLSLTVVVMGVTVVMGVDVEVVRSSFLDSSLVTSSFKLDVDVVKVSFLDYNRVTSSFKVFTSF